MIRAIISFEQGDKLLALTNIEEAHKSLRKLLRNVYQKMKEPYIARSVWVRYIAGIHGWGMTNKSDKVLTEYGGLSGSQILVFSAVDAFLGLIPYHSEELLEMHVSKNMRDLCDVLGNHSFRNSLSGTEGQEEDTAIRKALDCMVKELRVSLITTSSVVPILINFRLLGVRIGYEQFDIYENLHLSGCQ